MNFFEGILLGIIQGITEWLPISSSGQSMLFLINLLHMDPDQAFSTSVLLHLGSLLAVVYYFRTKLRRIFFEEKNLLTFILTASLASAIIGLPLYYGLSKIFTSLSGELVTMFIGAMLIITGFVLRRTGGEGRAEISSKDAILAGGAQGIAVLPGISRSGTTLSALLLNGIDQETALSLSFILAIPAILGLAALDFLESGPTSITLPLIAGIATSFFVSLATMHYFLALAKKVDFSVFAIAVGSLAFFVPLIFMGAEKII
jgi:undecaprenyl-diphosphatase